MAIMIIVILKFFNISFYVAQVQHLYLIVKTAQKKRG